MKHAPKHAYSYTHACVCAFTNVFISSWLSRYMLGIHHRKIYTRFSWNEFKSRESEKDIDAQHTRPAARTNRYYCYVLRAHISRWLYDASTISLRSAALVMLLCTTTDAVQAKLNVLSRFFALSMPSSESGCFSIVSDIFESMRSHFCATNQKKSHV